MHNTIRLYWALADWTFQGIRGPTMVSYELDVGLTSPRSQGSHYEFTWNLLLDWASGLMF